MKLYLAFILFTCWPLSDAFAQGKAKPILVATLDRRDYFFIPKNALADSVDGIIYQDKVIRKVPLNNRLIEIYLFSSCNDGDYKLTITPEQIFFIGVQKSESKSFVLGDKYQSNLL